MDSSAVAANAGLLSTLTTAEQREAERGGEAEEEEGEQKAGTMIELKAAALSSCNTNISTHSGFNS